MQRVSTVLALMLRPRFERPPDAGSFYGLSLGNLAIFACMNLSAQSHSAAAAPAHLTIDPTDIVTPVSPMLYGMMTEESQSCF